MTRAHNRRIPDERIVALRQQGLTYREIGQTLWTETGRWIDVNVLWRSYKRATTPKPDKPDKRARPDAKLTMGDVRLIRQGYEDGVSMHKLALMHAVSVPNVHHIVHRRRWAWVD